MKKNKWEIFISGYLKKQQEISKFTPKNINGLFQFDRGKNWPFAEELFLGLVVLRLVVLGLVLLLLFVNSFSRKEKNC